MAAEVSSIVRITNGCDSSAAGGGGGQSTAGIVTRDLLGGSKELDLDLQVPSGWEKLLDINSGKVYLQKCNALSSSSSTSERKQVHNQVVSKLQDLNYPPVAEKTSKLLDDATVDVDLKLVPLATLIPSSSNYQSVCTLDKVKYALEKVEKESRKRSSTTLSKGSSPPSSNSSSSIKDGEINQEDNSPSSFATGCPSCLMYVLITKSDPKCPRCNSIVPSPPRIMNKKPRIDLNLTI